jgi:hypothetical protein
MTRPANGRELYSVTALFDAPEGLLGAAEEAVKKGYTLFDCHTPYPVHGLDRAMNLKPSRLGYFAFAFGVLGALTAVTFISWVTNVDYPLVIGGKPFWSWPAFVPVSFELTVLAASVLSTAAMIVFYFRFPNISHPLHDTKYMKAVSSDRFGISIEARDGRFDEREVTELLRASGGREISPVFFDAEDPGHGVRLLDLRFLGVLAVTALAVSAVTYGTLNRGLEYQPFNWMRTQDKLKAQAPSAVFADGIGMRPPVEGTVARGYLPYPYKGSPDSAALHLHNPLLPSEGVIEKGRRGFLTFCSPCHGDLGRGDSRLAGQFPNPPTLHSDKVRSWPDGRIYHVITEGQNVMPSYASQIRSDDRWEIIHYIRVLQRAQNAKESDLK